MRVLTTSQNLSVSTLHLLSPRSCPKRIAASRPSSPFLNHCRYRPHQGDIARYALQNDMHYMALRTYTCIYVDPGNELRILIGPPFTAVLSKASKPVSMMDALGKHHVTKEEPLSLLECCSATWAVGGDGLDEIWAASIQKYPG